MSDEVKRPARPAPDTGNFSQQAIHLLRTTTQVNVSLSQMADQKASILMGATFVVFTLVVGQASRGEVPLALLVLACFAFVSALLAVAAILPSIRPVNVPPEQQNLLFFGTFTGLSEQEFVDRMLPLLRSDDSVFRTMLRDIYQNGQVLQRKKYRFLSTAYRVFLLGLTSTLVTFIIEQRAVLAKLFH